MGVAQFVHSYISPFIMEYGCLLCIQHNNQETQGSVISMVSLQRPPRTSTFIFVFVSHFLHPVKQQQRLTDWDIRRGACADNAGGGRGWAGWGLLRVQSDGEMEWTWDRRNVWDLHIRLSHWQSRRTVGSGVVAHCRKIPCCHLGIKKQQQSVSSR